MLMKLVVLVVILKCLSLRDSYAQVTVGNTKSVQKCIEYSKSVFEEQQSNIHALINNASTNKKLDTCVLNAVPLIVGGGRLASSREFPHYALLGYNDTVTNFEEIGWFGAGSLISTRYVLTAAHNLSPRHFGPVRKVRLGDFDDDRFITDIPVEQIISHPDFKWPDVLMIRHDIGLIKLVEKVQFSRFIRPICLPTLDTIPSNKLIESGWQSNPNYESGRNKVHRDIVDVITNEACSLHYLYNISRIQNQGIIDKQMCASFNSTDRGFCRGDMLQMFHPDTYCMYIQIGVASFGHECNPGVPSLFTRVLSYTNWIEDIIWAPGQDD